MLKNDNLQKAKFIAAKPALQQDWRVVTNLQKKQAVHWMAPLILTSLRMQHWHVIARNAFPRVIRRYSCWQEASENFNLFPFLLLTLLFRSEPSDFAGTSSSQSTSGTTQWRRQSHLGKWATDSTFGCQLHNTCTSYCRSNTHLQI